MSVTPRSKWQDVAAFGRRRNQTLRSFRRTVNQLETLEDRKLMTISGLTASPNPLITVEGSPAQALTVTFHDDVTFIGNVNIDWGDGQVDSGFGISDGSGNVSVTLNHAYLEEGAYNISLGATNFFDSTDSASTTDSALVADAALTPGTASPVRATEGVAFTQQVATFQDNDPNGTLPSDYQAQINWGDGQTSLGAITYMGGNTFSVAGTHTYAEEGIFPSKVNGPVTVTIYDTDGDPTHFGQSWRASTSLTTSATVGDAPISVAGPATQPLAPTVYEGVFASGVVAVITDTNTFPGAPGPGHNGNPAQDFTANGGSVTINWGDGGSSLATNVTYIGNGKFNVTGAHTYAESGPYNITVKAVDEGGSTNTSANIPITVKDAPIGIQAGSISGTEGSPSTSTVATLFDVNPNAPVNDYTVTVDWGDGQVDTLAPGNPNLSVAVISRSSTLATFSVKATHTYKEEGIFTAKVTVKDAEGSVSNTVTEKATIQDAPLSVAPVQPAVTVTEGAAFKNVPVATFTDADPNAVAGDFVTTILWGDGTSSSGTVTGPVGGVFTVLGSHTYTEDGKYNILAQVTDTEGLPIGSPSPVARASTSPVNTVTVLDAALTGTPVNVNTTEGAPLVNVLVGTFTDADPNGQMTGQGGGTHDDYVATIDWGDGTTSTGLIVLTDPTKPYNATTNPFQVLGSHVYAEDSLDNGAFNIKTVVTDVDGGGVVPAATTTINSSAFIADAPFVSAIPAAPPIVTQEGALFSGTVVNVVNADPFENEAPDATGNPVTIDWGDGTSSLGTAVNTGLGAYSITGSHQYKEEGTYTAKVTLGEGGVLNTISNTVSVNDAPLSSTPVNIPASAGATEGAPFTGTVATFTDADPNGVPGDYTVTIDWGNGTTSPGTAVFDGVDGAGAHFHVVGTHAYNEEGVYVQNPFNGVGGIQVSIVDTEGKNPAPASPNGRASTTAASSIVVSDASLTPNPLTVRADNAGAALSEGNAFTADVAKFTDTDPFGALGDYGTPLISWGDGSVSAGTVVHRVGDAATTFTVVGTHAYTEEGQMPLQVKVSDFGGAVTVVGGTAVVQDAPLQAGPNVSASAVEGSVFSGLLGTFTDSDPGAAANDYQVTINWGDGTSSPGTVVQTGSTFSVYYTALDANPHIYKEEGAFSPSVVVTDVGGPGDAPNGIGGPVGNVTRASTILSPSLTVTDAPLVAGSSSTTNGAEGTTAATYTGKFTDSDPYGASLPGETTATEYSAVIDWGDGQTSVGTVSRNGGDPPQVFTVTGSHVYKEEGAYTVNAVATDTDNGSPVTPRASVALAAASVRAEDAPLTATSPATITYSEGSSSPVTVATFTDADPNAVAGDFVASINWGDGSASNGVITKVGSTFQVQGTHAYTEEGNYAITTQITDTDGLVIPVFLPRATTSTTSKAVVLDAALTPNAPVALSGTEGSALSGVVGKFTDADVNSNTGDFTVTQIDWGDGSTSAGSVTHLVGDPSNVFAITGSHIYAEPKAGGGSYLIRATVYDTEPGGPTTGRNNTTTTGTAAIADALLSVNPFPLTLNGVEGALLNIGGPNVPTAFFHDNNTFSATPSDYVITINWGDGTSSAGIAQTAGSGNWLVRSVGGHAYAEEGTYTVTTVIQDVDGTPPITATTKAVIVDAPLTNGVGNTINLPSGVTTVPFNTALGSFKDLGGNLGSSKDDYKVIIQWGDFSPTDTTSGFVDRAGDGQYSVFTSGHAYPAVSGTYKVKVTVVDTDGGPVALNGAGNPIIPAGRGNVTFIATVTDDVPPAPVAMARVGTTAVALASVPNSSSKPADPTGSATDAALADLSMTVTPVRSSRGVLVGLVGKKSGSIFN